MPKPMTHTEVQTLVSTAKSVDTYEYGSPDDEDYFTATLFRTKEGRHFRHIDSAGMESDKTPNTGEWLTDAEVRKWKPF